jgi:hypothetical protein
MMPSRRLLLLTCCLAAALLSGCTREARLSVINRSAAELTNVVASGTGFAEVIGSIPAGGERLATVRPTSESGVQLDFDANGRHFTSPSQGYFEANSGYEVNATVGPDFTVAVDAR